MKPKNITLKHIAEAAGVSVMTVSRSLRNHPSQAEATRQRIQKLAERMGYRPHPLISALMTYRRSARPVPSYSSIGFVTSFASRGGWKDSSIYQEFFKGASESADRHGFRLDEFWLKEPGMTGQRLSSILYARNIQGLVIAPLPAAQGHLNLEWERFSAVTFGYSLARPLLHRAANHQFRSMRLAIRKLRKLGYRRLGLAMSASYDTRVDHHWVGSFLLEQRQCSPADCVPIFCVDDPHWTEENFLRWFREANPQVVISQQEEILQWLAGCGKKVPDDVGFVHLNCPDFSGQFAGIRQNGLAVGAVAIDFLVGMIYRNERGIPGLAHTILVEGTWVDGSTVRSLRTEGQMANSK